MLGARNRNSQMMEAFLTLLVQMRRQRVIAWIPERTWKVASGRHNLCLSIIIPLSCSLLHPLFIPASVDLQKQSGREMGRRGYRALLSLLLSVVLFFVFVPDPIVRAVLIPAKFDGFVYNTTGTSPDSIVIEAFFDPVCPDSRDDWLPLKRVLAYYAGRVSLIVHPFPLPSVILSLDFVFFNYRFPFLNCLLLVALMVLVQVFFFFFFNGESENRWFIC